MTNRALTAISLPALAAALLFASPAAAQSTECQPDDLFCAELRIGPGSAGVRIGGAPQPPPVVVEPAPEPPVVVVEQAPPPPPPVVVQPAPQPPTVIVQPAPQPPPQRVYVQQAPQRTVVVQRERDDRYPYSSTGLHLHLSGLFGDNLAMGGAGAAFRIRPIPHLAIDIGSGIYGGQDYNGMDRVEVPVTTDLLIFFNPQHRFQFYVLGGLGLSFGHAEGYNIHTHGGDSRDYVHLGGELGLGVEWRISRVFALNLDVRGFIRQRVDDNGRPEFRELTDSGWQSTDTSGGFLGRLGMTFYFGR